MLEAVAFFVAGLCAGGGAAWLWARARTARLEAELAMERAAAKEKLALLDDARQRFSDTFQALSAEALRQNSSSFLELANVSLERFQASARGDLERRQTAIGELVKPVRDSLEKVDAKIQELEKARAGAYEGLVTQIRSMGEAQSQLRAETHRLSTALRSPVVRGRWGEVQLRRVVELAGMLPHCDFTEQASQATENGRQRPDMIVHLPGGKEIIVDAKAPLAAYLEAMEAPDEETRGRKMREHAAQLRAHIDALGKKAYWEQFPEAPELVVLFLPGESFLSAAMESDPTLLEYGTERKVILATPATLISLLKAVFYGWRQQRLAESAGEIARLGRELGKRLADMGCHVDRLGKSLKGAVDHYNRLVATTESRVLVTVRKFHGLEPETPGEEPAALEQIEATPRHLQAPEWTRDEVERTES
ncbi:MAG: DNA recombination protein RmuC [Chthoniobacteraceae bacterium]|nr:DNA recombination protein RmuC [Chthoniobacteraceae bacterium]